MKPLTPLRLNIHPRHDPPFRHVGFPHIHYREGVYAAAASLSVDRDRERGQTVARRPLLVDPYFEEVFAGLSGGEGGEPVAPSGNSS